MKKFICYILIIFFIPIITHAKEIVIENKIISFIAPEGYGLQSFTVVNDNLFIVLVGDNDNTSLFKVYDLRNYEEIYSAFNRSVGHANDTTYNPKENNIYIAHAGGSDQISIIDGDTYQILSSFSIGLPIRSITYIEEKDLYAVRLVTNGYLLNSSFQKTQVTPFVMGMNMNEKVGRQGWCYYNELIWYANWSWIRLGGNGTNDIMVYDLEGHKLEDFITSATIGEIEDIAFYQNQMLLGFNSYDGKIEFYLEEVPFVGKYVKLEKEKEEEINENNKSYYYFIIFLLVPFLFFLQKKKVIH